MGRLRTRPLASRRREETRSTVIDTFDLRAFARLGLNTVPTLFLERRATKIVKQYYDISVQPGFFLHSFAQWIEGLALKSRFSGSDLFSILTSERA